MFKVFRVVTTPHRAALLPAEKKFIWLTKSPCFLSCMTPISSEKHLVFYHIFSQFFTNFFEFYKSKTKNTEKNRNFTSRLLAETKFLLKFRRNFAEKVNPRRQWLGGNSERPGASSCLPSYAPRKGYDDPVEYKPRNCSCWSTIGAAGFLFLWPAVLAWYRLTASA